MTLLPRIGIQNSFVAKAFLVLAGIAMSSSALATMTLVSVSGASRTDLSDTAKPKIFAGFAGTCTENNTGTTTCDSCTGVDVGGTKLVPCNKTNAYTTLTMVIRTQFTGAAGTSPSPFVKIDSTTINSFRQTVESGSNVLVTELPWGQLCNEINNDATCLTAIPNKEIVIGLTTTGTGGTGATESISLFINTRAIESTTPGTGWTYTDCNTVAAANNSGFCHFQAYPGDGKIYADELVLAPQKLETGISGIEYTNLVFFTAKDETGSMTDAAIVASITNKSEMTVLGVNKSADPPVADNRVSGLTNTQRYCMVMANQDSTGNISFFTPVADVSTDSLCATPSEVIGLLDNKKCFIATAAFGSEMAPEVQSFRDFRNEYLLSNPLGRAFVKTYYKYSPFYANMIAESEVAKAVVRTALWPLLFFARLSVQIGLWFSLLIMVLASVSVYELYRRVVIGKKIKGEL